MSFVQRAHGGHETNGAVGEEQRASVLPEGWDVSKDLGGGGGGGGAVRGCGEVAASR